MYLKLFQQAIDETTSDGQAKNYPIAAQSLHSTEPLRSKVNELKSKPMLLLNAKYFIALEPHDSLLLCWEILNNFSWLLS